MKSTEKNSITVLCTRPLDAELIDAAAMQHITLDTLSFITTEAITSIEVQQEIENALILSATVVFTSMNAVEAVAVHLFDEQPAWNIYCIGQTTQQLVKKYFGIGAVAGTADSAAELAELIAAESGAEEVIFFCGDRRRDELPNILSDNNMETTEVVVYQTIAVSHKINKAYQALLFFSPSAVQSYFANNKATAEVVFFAIGDTTAAEIRKFTANKILIAALPGKEALVQAMIAYFTN